MLSSSVSLSHFSFVSTCVYPGERSSRPTPTRIGGGGEGSVIGGGLSRGRGASRFFSLMKHGIGGGKLHIDAGWRRHGARSFFRLASTVSGPYPFGSFRRMDSGALAGPAWTCPMSADFLRGQVMSLNSGCLPRQTAGALIVTLLVTIQGTARALKHARAPSRPGTNGGAQAATCNAPSPS